MATKKWAEEEESSDEEVEKRVDEPERRPQQGNAGHAAPTRQQPPASGLTGYMTGINFRARWKDVEDFLWDNSCRVAEVEMIPDAMNPRRSSGKAKIYLKDEASLEQFIQLNDVEFMGMKIRTKEWTEERPAPRDSYRSNDVRGGGGDNRGGDRDRRSYRQGGDRDNNYPSRGDNNRGGGGGGGGGGGVERRPRGGSGEFFRHNNSHYTRRRDEHDDRDNHPKEGDNDPASTSTSIAPKEKTERPRIQLAPRTKPIEEIGKIDQRKADIFGGGSAHDEFEYEKRRKEREAAVAPAPASAAPSGASAATSPLPSGPTAGGVSDGSYSVQPPTAASAADEESGYKEVSNSRTRVRGQSNNSVSNGGRGSYKGAAGAGTSLTPDTTATTGGGGRGGRGNREGGRAGGRGEGRGGRGDRDRERRPSSANPNNAANNLSEQVQSLQIDQDAALALQLANNPISPPANANPEEEGFITVDRKRASKPAASDPLAPAAGGGKGGDYKKRPARGDGPPPPRTSGSNNKGDRADKGERPASAKANSKPRGAAGNSNGGTAAIAAAAIKDATASAAAASVAKSASAASTTVATGKVVKQQGGLAGLAAESDDE